jgi:hypothetical protein
MAPLAAVAALAAAVGAANLAGSASAMPPPAKYATMKKTFYSPPALNEATTAANHRYLKFLSTLDDPSSGAKALKKLSAPVHDADRSWRGFKVVSLSLCRRVEEGKEEGEAPRDIGHASGLPCQGGEELAPWKRVPPLSRLSKRRFVRTSARCSEGRFA